MGNNYFTSWKKEKNQQQQRRKKKHKKITNIAEIWNWQILISWLISRLTICPLR
jgi:hypothetical protein